MKKLHFLLFFILGLIHLTAIAQKKNESYQLNIKKTQTPVKIDGVMSEQAWKESEVAKDFFMVLPMDTSRARVRTEVRMTYDDKNLYLIALCYKALPGPYYVESLRRDFNFGKNDNFLLFMDPFNDQTTGFSFGANAAGAQWDGTMFGGGSVDLNWDNKWLSEVKNDPEKWVFEMAIPFTTIRYKKDAKKWGINFSRNDLKTTEKSSWTPIPRQFPTASLAYTGSLIWDNPPPEPGLNISVIPYVLAGVSKDYEANTSATSKQKIGTDVKIGLTSSLNLDLTINPDFSQVEVDRQVTNLERFELFFPERRQFFLENGDLFGNFGYSTIRPFFSRRIGLGVPIQAGARISGKLNKDWRIGLMNMQTARDQNKNLPAQNFGIVSLQRRVFSRSNIGLLIVNKESVNYNPDPLSSEPVYSKYNRNIGMEYNLASSNNLFTGKTFFMKSISPNRKGNEIAQASHLQYNSRKWNLLLQEEYVGKNYNAEVGYVPRNSYFKINPVAGRLFFPKGGKILSHGPKLSGSYFFNEFFRKTDNQNMLAYAINFRKQSVFSAAIINEYIELLQPFDPTNSGKGTLAAGTQHNWFSWRTEFVSKPQSVLTYALSTMNGGYYANGSRLNLAGEIGYRFQPYVNFLINTSYNNIQLPQPWNQTNFWLLGTQVNVTMTNKLFFSTFLQYNEQNRNINLNSRFQWRYQPASDLFIVYTDNYLPAPFSVRNRALVLKLTYWWNKK
ncbi:MAG: carbohydrate binding family 9 domain-containing protein [Flavobacterium sp.]|nr:carbohydrate binding family 9 domain-containing protein [Pedobacter sp.]